MLTVHNVMQNIPEFSTPRNNRNAKYNKQLLKNLGNSIKSRTDDIIFFLNFKVMEY